MRLEPPPPGMRIRRSVALTETLQRIATMPREQRLAEMRAARRARQRPPRGQLTLSLESDPPAAPSNDGRNETPELSGRCGVGD
jgi:hypothetical protein